MIDVLKVVAGVLTLILAVTVLWLDADQRECEVCAFENIKQ